MTGSVLRWRIGLPPGEAALGLGPEDGVVALTAAELAAATGRAGTAVGCHELLDDPGTLTGGGNATGRTGTGGPSAARVDVHFPAYRPRSLLPVLAWLAARLGGPGTDVVWHVDKRQGPDTVLRHLAADGWQLARGRLGRTVVLRGAAPEAPAPPAPATIRVRLGRNDLDLDADYGVFSPRQLDAGTALLLETTLAVLDGGQVDRVVDVGTGYGPLAIGLVLAGAATAAVGSDVDCLALWLAGRNAARHGVPLARLAEPDPARLPASELTVCNVPTHVDAAATTALVAGLARRARQGRLLVVVHASLEERYVRHLDAGGVRVHAHRGPEHVVLAAHR